MSSGDLKSTVYIEYCSSFEVEGKIAQEDIRRKIRFQLIGAGVRRCRIEIKGGQASILYKNLLTTKEEKYSRIVKVKIVVFSLEDVEKILVSVNKIFYILKTNFLRYKDDKNLILFLSEEGVF